MHTQACIHAHRYRGMQTDKQACIQVHRHRAQAQRYTCTGIWYIHVGTVCIDAYKSHRPTEAQRYTCRHTDMYKVHMIMHSPSTWKHMHKDTHVCIHALGGTQALSTHMHTYTQAYIHTCTGAHG